MRYYICVRDNEGEEEASTPIALSGGGLPLYADHKHRAVKFVKRDDAEKFAIFVEHHLSRLPGQDRRITVLMEGSDP